MSTKLTGLLGYLRSTMTLLFPASLCGIHFVPAPVPLRVRVHPLMRFCLSSEYMAVQTCRRPARRRSPPLGSLSSSRHQSEESTNNEHSHTRLMIRPQCSSHSRRFTPLRTLRAYFIPQPRPGFTFQGFSPLPSRTSLIDWPSPHDVYRLSPPVRVAPYGPDPAAPPSGCCSE